MDELLREKRCTEFASSLASAAPVPGGGGSAALVGALGAALCSMAGNLTLGRKKYAAVEPDIRRMLEKGEQVRNRLLELIDEDAVAFEPLSRAYSIPKEDPTRTQVLEAATLQACAAPLEMIEQCAAAAALLEEMLEKGSVMLISDVGCGALCCRAALESAALNVYVNTRTLQDRDAAARLEQRVDALLENWLPRTAAVAEEVRRRLRK